MKNQLILTNETVKEIEEILVSNIHKINEDSDDVIFRITNAFINLEELLNGKAICINTIYTLTNYSNMILSELDNEDELLIKQFIDILYKLQSKNPLLKINPVKFSNSSMYGEIDNQINPIILIQFKNKKESDNFIITNKNITVFEITGCTNVNQQEILKESKNNIVVIKQYITDDNKWFSKTPLYLASYAFIKTVNILYNIKSRTNEFDNILDILLKDNNKIQYNGKLDFNKYGVFLNSVQTKKM